MSKATKIGIIAGVVVVFVLLLIFFGGRTKEEVYVNDNWDQTYDPKDKGPYGTYVLKQLLDTAGLFGNFVELNKKLKDEIEDDEEINDIYFFVGVENHMTPEDADFLKEFVSTGNTVFMSAEYFPYDFVNDFTYEPDSLLMRPCVWDSIQYFKFEHQQLRSKRYTSTFIYNNDVISRDWNYFDTLNFNIEEEDTLIYLGGNTKASWNFLKIQYGQGNIFLHSTPYLFTNISLMKRSGFDYAEKILAHIPPGRIQWDRYNLRMHYSNNRGGDGSGNGDEPRQSILEFILANPPLAWAMFLLIIGGVLYGLFKGKRMQRVIPAAESKENTSLGYINTLASLYLQENKHAKLVHLKERTFLNFIAEHYYITCKEPDEKFIAAVAVKSQVDIDKIREIFTIFKKLEGVTIVSDEELILLHRKIEYFYKKCR